MKTISQLLAASLLALAALPARAGDGLDGYWMDSNGEVILNIRSCGKAKCGRVAWLRLPYGPDGLPILDYRNPDPNLRNRPVCGLEVVSGFERQEDGTYGNGTVYVSDLGSSYSGYAEVLSPTQVKVTGYVFLPLFGLSEVWTRVAGPPHPCLKPGERPPATAAKPAPAPAPSPGAPPSSSASAH